jgi:hypothetical protein
MRIAGEKEPLRRILAWTVGLAEVVSLRVAEPDNVGVLAAGEKC